MKEVERACGGTISSRLHSLKRNERHIARVCVVSRVFFKEDWNFEKPKTSFFVVTMFSPDSLYFMRDVWAFMTLDYDGVYEQD